MICRAQKSSQQNDYPPEKKPRLDDSLLEESALALVKPTPEPVIASKLVTRPVISPKAPETAAVTTSVIASVTATNSVTCIPTPVVPPVIPSDNLVIPVAHSAPVPHASVENEPISLIKTSTPPIIPPAASMKSHTPPLAYNQPSFPPMVSRIYTRIKATNEWRLTRCFIFVRIEGLFSESICY